MDLLLEGNQASNIFLHDGDILEIYKTTNVDKKIIDIAQANFSPKTINVNIIGEVNEPGRKS